MQVRIAAAEKAVTSAKVRVGATWKDVSAIRAFIDGQWREIARFTASLTASISPSIVSGSRTGSGTATTEAATATPTGGVAPYSYAWTQIFGPAFTITSPATASTSFSKALANGDYSEAVFRCTVTDATGATASPEVTATLTSFFAGGSGGGPGGGGLEEF